MCPSSGHWEELWVRLIRRVVRSWQSGNLRPVALLGLPALGGLLVLYCFPVFSVLVLCGAAAVWYYHRSGGTLWRLPFHRKQLRGGVPRLRQREAAVRWTSPPSSLLLMGSYLSTQEPPGQGLARGRDYKERLMRPNPTVPTPTRRLSFRDTPGLANQGLLCSYRRYPLKQPQFSRPGSLPTVCFEECQNKLPLKRSRATVKLPHFNTNFARSPILESLLSPGPSSPPVECAPDPCAKETVLNAIQECMKRKQMNKECSMSDESENKRRRLESCGSAESSSEYHLPTGTLPSYVSESGSLKRGLNSNVLEDHMNKRPCASSVSSRSSSPIIGIKRPTHDPIKRPTHNAITSSYSSIVSPNKRRKRSLQNISAGSSSPSPNCHCLSAKKSRESEESGQSTPLQSEKDQSGGCMASEPPSAANSSSEKGKRFPRGEKMLYLISKREPYKMPVPHDPGFYVTKEMYDSARKKSFERLNELLGGTAAPAQTVNTSPVNKKVSVSPALSSLEPANSAISSLTTSSLPAPAITEVFNSAPPPPYDNPQPKSEPPQTSLLQILTKPLENDSHSGFKPIFPMVSPVTSSSGMMTTATAPTTDTFKPIFGDSSSLSTQSSSTVKPIFGSSTAQQPASSFTFQMGSTTSAAISLPGFCAVTTSAPVSAIIAPKPSLAPPISSIGGTTNTLASLFPSAAAATSTSGTASAPVNSLLVSSAPAATQAKQFVFGQTTTSQATPGLNVFSSIQPASVSAPQQSAPSQQSSLFAFNTSAFTAPVSSNSSAPIANSGTSTSGSSNIQPTFGGFGTNSNPVTNLFASKHIASAVNSSAPSFCTINATPTQNFNFGNSLAQNNVIQNSSTPLAFGAQGTSENELSFVSQFGQSSPAAPIPFSISSPASTGSPFGNFKTGVTTKPSGARQRVLARRQRKK
ncbi:nuclear envelope pore membrane protein POM 121 [Hyperolius riggenbachi]|uniref:nuclear envelope pore membrane protein POM 121 n=1 Tax=Hyperolius riggenbachi TaxID=752182 RepID=UPI0035A309BE